MSREVRLGIITENHYPRLGGMEFQYHALAMALARCPRLRVALACSTMREVPRDFSYPYKVYRSASFSILTRFLVRKNIEKMIREGKVNVLHGATLHGSGVDAVQAGKRFDLPVVVQSHGSDVQVVEEIGYGAMLNPENMKRVQFVLENADQVLAASHMNRQMILDLGGRPERTHVIWTGTLHEEIGTVPFIDVRGKYGLEPDDFVIITVGRNRPIKRMDLLFAALAILKRRRINIKCLCVGPAGDLPDMVNEHGLEGVVVLTGRIPDREAVYGGQSPPFPELVNLYRAADLYVSVSYFEAFSLTTLDALACGIPVLLTSRHGERDAITEGETGFVLREDTAECLAEELALLLEKRHELRKRRDMIRRSVSHLTWEKYVERLQNIYSSLL